jgi:hypothetical protein
VCHDSAGIASDFEAETAYHGYHKTPCLVVNAEHSVVENEEDVEPEEEAITGDTREVLEIRKEEGA